MRPLILVVGGYPLFADLFALIPVIRNLESDLARHEASREAEEAAD